MKTVDISEVLISEMTLLDCEAFSDKDQLFDFMSKKFAENGVVTEAGKFKQALYDREVEGSTYIGDMIAMPHGICDEVAKAGVGFCRVKQPFVYRSHDEEGEVQYIFMMAIPKDDGQNQHLKIMAALARLLAHEEFREILGSVESYEKMIDAIQKIEKEVEICS